MKTLLLALVLCVSLVSCECISGSHQNLVKSSKEVYINNLKSILELENPSLNESLDELIVSSEIMNAELKKDSLLMKIYLEKRDQINLVKKEREDKIAEIMAIQDSLLKNDTVLISRGIRITDNEFDVELKFEYYESTQKLKESVNYIDSLGNDADAQLVKRYYKKYVVESDMGCEAYINALKVQNKEASANTNFYMNTVFYTF